MSTCHSSQSRVPCLQPRRKRKRRSLNPSNHPVARHQIPLSLHTTWRSPFVPNLRVPADFLGRRVERMLPCQRQDRRDRSPQKITHLLPRAWANRTSHHRRGPRRRKLASSFQRRTNHDGYHVLLMSNQHIYLLYTTTY